MKWFEANFDGLVGPTHNYAGLSFGNIASKANANNHSNPKLAAKEGLQKMKTLNDLGLVQGVLAPQERPDIYTLRRLGFAGSDKQIIEAAGKQSLAVLRACYSASSMWTANAATVSPSADSADNKLHFTPANLNNQFHRSIEPETTGRILQAIFNNDKHFAHHQHLPESDFFGDEGAANHTRLCSEHGSKGIQVFVFGKTAFNSSAPKPSKFPARQTLEASQAIARLHHLDESNTVFMQQNPAIIDAGAFHNDVVSVGNQNVLFYHEQAFLNTAEDFAQIQHKFGQDKKLHFIGVKESDVTVQEAIKTYLFNTQIITLPNGEMTIVAPMECHDDARVKAYLDKLVTLETPITSVKFFDVKQSMSNGGGPACLRLRVAMNESELAATNQQCLMSDTLFASLNQWVDNHYRDEIKDEDLLDPQLLVESRTALDELTQILNLGSVYTFQQN